MMCSVENICFYQGTDEIRDVDKLKKIKEKIAEFFNIKNVNFLLGAGTSSDAIPCMKVIQETINTEIKGADERIKNL